MISCLFQNTMERGRHGWGGFMRIVLNFATIMESLRDN
jgi:hypothetical protein